MKKIQKSSALYLSILCCSIGLFSGCVMNEDKPHTQIAPEKVRLADDIHLAKDGWPAARWWTHYNDPQLNALMDYAIEKAPNMTIAQIRISQAHAQAGMLGTWWMNMQVMAGGILTDGFQGWNIMANYSVDLWGKQRKQVEAAIGAKNAHVAEAAAVELELSAEIASLYYRIQMTYQLIDLLKQANEVWELALQAKQAKSINGLDAPLAINNIRAQQISIDRQIASAQGQIKEIREALRALIGSGADDMPGIKPMPLPENQANLPSELSYELLARRPDLQAMRWYVQASLSEIEAKEAAFYPSLNLAGLFIFGELEVGNLLKKSTQQSIGLPLVYLPIFDIGRLNAALDNARATRDLLIEHYNQSVLNAVREVAVSCNNLQTLETERNLQVKKLENMESLQRAAEAAYKSGLRTKVEATEARLPVILEKQSLVLIDGQRLFQEITLIKALGGGYRAEESK